MFLLSEAIKLDKKDNVLVARKDIAAGTKVLDNITVLNDIPAGYKVAAVFIAKGDPVIKFNTIIGHATVDCPAGTLMHTHNIAHDRAVVDVSFCADVQPVDYIPKEKRATFQGIVRQDGRVATRNYIGVFIVSNCAATVARKISQHFTTQILSDYPNIDGVVPFITELGCGMELTGEPMDLLQRTMSGHIRHPNIAASLIVALGCERNNIDAFFKHEGLIENETCRRLVMQEIGGTKAAIDEGISIVSAMLPKANDVNRSTVSAEHLMLALECGGSDGFSGISANPGLGRASDLLVRNGGTVILSETPEIFGVHHTLTRRAVSPNVAQKLLDRINWWLEYSAGRDNQINGNVSPGNNMGGIANVTEKALGGVKKSGSTPMVDVYRYAEKVDKKGFVFMDTPGYDPIAATGQIAGGANIMCFTTGRGSCFGSVPTPVIKLASNTPMYEKMIGDMDINCGVVIDGEMDLDALGELIFQKILKVASGEKSKSEELGVGENEYMPWPIGVFA
jgi:altronate hydrolase